jgi:hypothetical protein
VSRANKAVDEVSLAASSTLTTHMQLQPHYSSSSSSSSSPSSSRSGPHKVQKKVRSKDAHRVAGQQVAGGGDDVGEEGGVGDRRHHDLQAGDHSGGGAAQVVHRDVGQLGYQVRDAACSDKSDSMRRWFGVKQALLLSGCGSTSRITLLLLEQASGSSSWAQQARKLPPTEATSAQSNNNKKSVPASSLLQGCSDDGITFSFCTIARAPHAHVVASMPARFCGTPTSQLQSAKQPSEVGMRGAHMQL